MLADGEDDMDILELEMLVAVVLMETSQRFKCFTGPMSELIELSRAQQEAILVHNHLHAN